MGRYRKNPNRLRGQVNLTIDPEVWEEAKKLFRAAGLSVSAFVNDALKAKVHEAKGALNAPLREPEPENGHGVGKMRAEAGHANKEAREAVKRAKKSTKKRKPGGT